MKLIAVFQSIDLLLSLNTILPSILFETNGILCSVQGFNEQLFSTSEVIWQIWFSLYVYRTIVLNQDKYEAINFKIALVVTLLITLPPAIIFFVLGLYKHDGVWCWVGYENRLENFFLVEFLSSYIFVFISFGCGAFVMWSVHKKVRKNTEFIDKNILRMQIYPLIMFICYFFMFVYRVLNAVQWDTPDGFKEFSAMLINLVGFMNFLVLGLTEEFKGGIRFVRGKEYENRVNLSSSSN